jgi:hypothetical protein
LLPNLLVKQNKCQCIIKSSSSFRMRDQWAVLAASHTAICGAFRFDRAVDMTSDRTKAYAADRQKANEANGSINRELAALKRARGTPIARQSLSGGVDIATWSCLRRLRSGRLCGVAAGGLRPSFAYLLNSPHRELPMGTVEFAIGETVPNSA